MLIDLREIQSEPKYLSSILKSFKKNSYPKLNFVGTNFENRLIDVLEKLSKEQDNAELEQRMEKLENISPKYSTILHF